MPSEFSFDKEEDMPWGFQLTGGPKFDMPLTVFEVIEGGRAYRAGVRLGDVLVKINGMDADQLSLEAAHQMIADAGNNITLAVSNIEDQENEENEMKNEVTTSTSASGLSIEDPDIEVSHHDEPSETEVTEGTSNVEASRSEDMATDAEEEFIEVTESEREIVEDTTSERDDDSVAQDSFEIPEEEDHKEANEEEEGMEEEQFVDVSTLSLVPPRPAPEPEYAQRRCWHPVMLDTSPPPIIEADTGDAEAPHKKLMRNLKAAISQKKVNASPEPPYKKKHYKSSRKRNQEATENKENSVPVAAAELEVRSALRTMQRQLKSLALLPAAMQAALNSVSGKLEHLLPDPAEPPPTDSDADDNGILSEESGEILEEDHTVSADMMSEDESLVATHTESEGDADVPSPTPASPAPPTLSARDIERAHKLEKLDSLNKSWPWGNAARPVYKISEHYDVSYGHAINNRVVLLEKIMTEEKVAGRRNNDTSPGAHF